jgi:hypothetical protein
MFRKTFSQKVALIFEIATFIKFILALTTVILSIALAIAVNPIVLAYVFFPFLIALLIVVVSLIFLVKYFRHARGMLDDEKIIPLWSGTFLYNLLLLIPIFNFYYHHYFTFTGFDYGPLSENRVFLFLTVFQAWLAVAMVLSVCALVSEIKNNDNAR